MSFCLSGGMEIKFPIVLKFWICSEAAEVRCSAGKGLMCMLGETQEKGRERTTWGSEYRVSMTDPDVLTIDHFQESGAFVWPSFDQCSKSRAKQESSHQDIENNPSRTATKHTLHDPASFLPAL